jgi:hypothetical protein
MRLLGPPVRSDDGLKIKGGIARRDLDWESGNLYGNWIATPPLLKHWIRAQAKFIEWQDEIVCGRMDYESYRFHFLGDAAAPIDGILAVGKNWVAFPSAVHLNQTRNFEYMIEKLHDAGYEKREILHTAESLFHDHLPANQAGLASAWIYRRHGQEGFGATHPPQAKPEYDFQFKSMGEMAKTHQKALR